MKATIEIWIAKRPSGALATMYAARTRKECIAKILTAGFRGHWTWQKLYRGGWRAVRCIATEI